MSSAKIYDFTLTAGGSFSLPVSGSYVRIMSSTGTVEIVADGFRIGPIVAGQGSKDKDFKRLTIVDRSGAANIGTVLVADSDFVDQTILGSVSVIDGGKARTIANNAFIGVNLYSAVAAQYSKVQLWNPANTGKSLILGAFSFSSTVAGSVYARYNTAALAISGSLSPASKLVGGAAPSALFRVESAATVTDPTLAGFNFLANSAVFYTPKEPFVIRPGYGLVINHQTVNADISANFEWFEEAI